MLKSTTIHTAHGYLVTVRRVGIEYDLETSDARGDVISTVRLSEGEFVALQDEMDDLAPGAGAYSLGYDDGYADGQAA